MNPRIQAAGSVVCCQTCYINKIRALPVIPDFFGKSQFRYIRRKINCLFYHVRLGVTIQNILP